MIRHCCRTAFLFGLLAIFCSPALLWAGAKDKRLDIYWIDVDGGASTLIVTPQGESVLIDTGNPGRRDANRIFTAAAEVAGLKQIDHLVITHYHRDHFGGASTLATFIPIKHVYDNGSFEGQRDKPDNDYLEFKCDKRVKINPGDRFEMQQSENAPALQLRCLATRQQMLEVKDAPATPAETCAAFQPQERDLSDNANSIVLLLQYGDFKFFDAGDLTWNVEYQLLCPHNKVGEVDVYQVTHHGLDSSNNPLLVHSLKPTLAVMNNGVTKGCQPRTFATLKNSPGLKALYQMHKNLREDSENNTPDEFIANLEKDCPGNIIKLSVAPDSKTYTVSIPGKQHEKEYQTKTPAKK